MLEASGLMSFVDDCIDLHSEPEIPDLESSHRIALEFTGDDATLLRLLGERLGLRPVSVVRIALVAFAAQGRRW
jgi:hypothetical protein